MSLIADIHNDMEKGAVRLITEYRARLISDAVRICENIGEAEDLVDRTFVKVIRNIESHHGDRNLYGWMKTIMVNVHRNDLARPVARGTEPVDAETLEAHAGADWSTDEEILRNSDSEAIHAAIKQLSPKYQEAILMRYYDEMSVKEIAAFLGKPIGTVCRRIQIAHRLLAGKLAVMLGRGKKPLAVILVAFLSLVSAAAVATLPAFEPLRATVAGWFGAPVETPAETPPSRVVAAAEPADQEETKTNEQFEVAREESQEMNKITNVIAAAVSATVLSTNAAAAESPASQPAKTAAVQGAAPVKLAAAAPVLKLNSATGGTRVWKGATSGDWHTPTNWDPEGVPTATNDIVLAAPKSGSYTVTASQPIGVRSLTIGSDGAAEGCTVTFESQTLGTNVVNGNLTVLAGGVMTHKAFSTSADTIAQQDQALILFVKGNATIAADGMLDVKKKGFASGKGPGHSVSADIDPVSHGGRMTGNNSKGNPNKPCYGSPLRPISGGSTNGRSMRGAGVIRLDVRGTLHLDGTIFASAGPGGNSSFDGASGGSAWVSAGRMEGSGTISADGAEAYYRWGGSGGRVAVYVDEGGDKPFGDVRMTARGGNSLHQSPYNAPAGTVYKCVGPNLTGGTLLIDNEGNNGACASAQTELDAANMEDAEAFGTIIVTNGATLNITSGTHVKLSGDLLVSGGTLKSAVDGAIEFVDSNVVSHVSGSPVFGTLVCTEPDKVIRFGTSAGEVTSIAEGGAMTVMGTKGHPVSLLGTESGKPWKFVVGRNCQVDIQQASIGYSDARDGMAVTAYSSNDLGNNQNWSILEPIDPGAPIAWNGNDSVDWGGLGNWTDSKGKHRLPIATDCVTIPKGCAHDPVLTADAEVGDLTIAQGATLTMSGAHLTVKGNLVVNGVIASEGAVDADHLICEGNVTFGSPSTFSRGVSQVALAGFGAQTVTANGAEFYELSVQKTGGTLTFAADFAADLLRVAPAAAQTISFDAGVAVSADGLILDGVASGGALSLVGTAGDAWKLTLSKSHGSRQLVRGVKVRDCDASDGALIVASGSTNLENNKGWSFDGVAPLVWTGAAGTTDFATAGNWSPEAVPGADSRVVLLDGASAVIGSAVAIGALSVSLDNKVATLKVNAALDIAGDLEAGAGARLTFNKPVSVGKNARFASGARLTHDAQPKGTAVVNKIDLSVDGDLLVSAGVTITATGKGFSADEDGKFLCSHGGIGGAITSSVGFGSVFAPVTCGGTCRAGSSGGVVRLAVRGAATIDGTVGADATDGDEIYSSAGGSVWISAKSISGAGLISACGYVTKDTTHAGGGGRISLCGLTPQFTGIADASSAYPGRSGNNAGAGTVYRQDAGAEPYAGTVFLRNDWAKDVTSMPSVNGTCLPMADDGKIAKYKSTKIVCDVGSNLRILKPMAVRDIDVVSKFARIDVGTNTLTVMSREHKKGKGWADALEKIVVTATDPTTGVKGKIVWAGGMALIIK